MTSGRRCVVTRLDVTNRALSHFGARGKLWKNLRLDNGFGRRSSVDAHFGRRFCTDSHPRSGLSRLRSRLGCRIRFRAETRTNIHNRGVTDGFHNQTPSHVHLVEFFRATGVLSGKILAFLGVRLHFACDMQPENGGPLSTNIVDGILGPRLPAPVE